MLTKMEVYGVTDGLPEIPLLGDSVDNDLIQIRDIGGLEPVKANINTTPFAGYNGEYYLGSNIGKRNIVVTFGLNPDWEDQSISTLRQLLQSYFMTQNQIKLRFFSDELPTCEILGYTESFEPNRFSKDPEVQVSIICPEPDFVGIVPTVINGTVQNTLEYTEIVYEGSVPTGFVLEVASSVTNPSYT
ncbi:MAG TPA: phage tail domain-containing protein, partial [Anaerolineales bacterium]|nr:phage tail domain-containing protein [Anaerolineales bacterium]